MSFCVVDGNQGQESVLYFESGQLLLHLHVENDGLEQKKCRCPQIESSWLRSLFKLHNIYYPLKLNTLASSRKYGALQAWLARKLDEKKILHYQFLLNHLHQWVIVKSLFVNLFSLFGSEKNKVSRGNTKYEHPPLGVISEKLMYKWCKFEYSTKFGTKPDPRQLMEKQDSSKLKLYYQSYTAICRKLCSTQYETHEAIKICLEICWCRNTCQARLIMKLRTTTKYKITSDALNEKKKNVILR